MESLESLVLPVGVAAVVFLVVGFLAGFGLGTEEQSRRG